jgi:methylated-DNA-[protein]-cysteine S-methyltransferase
MNPESKKATARDIGRSLRDAARPNSTGADALADELIRRAEREGLLDVAYTEVDSPFGRLLLAATPRGLVKLAFPLEPPENVLEQLAERVSPRVLESPAQLDPVRRELDRYFEGKLREFDLPLDWRLSNGFRRRVLRATARIPYGRTRSYSEVAKRAGNQRAVRAAGTALGHNPIPIVVPCHRVVRTGGAIGNYGGGPEMKKALLELEGALDPTA